MAPRASSPYDGGMALAAARLTESRLRFRRSQFKLKMPKPGSSSKRRGAVVVLPTLFTLGNLICGFASLHYAAKGSVSSGWYASNYAIAGYLIFGGMFFDLFDGFVARLARATSNFGAELDSLADMVTFGVAPAFLVLRLVNELMTGSRPLGEAGPWEALGPNADNVMGRLFWTIGALYVACTALRLARFNVFNSHDDSAHQAFRGLPSPGAAAVVASSIIFFETLHSEKHFIAFRLGPETIEYLHGLFPYVLPVLLLGSALLMVSRFTYAHLINRFLRGRKRFNYLIGIVLFLVLLIWLPQITALLFIYCYALSAPVVYLFRWVTGRKAPKPGVTTGSPLAGGAGEGAAGKGMGGGS